MSCHIGKQIALPYNKSPQS